MKTTCAFIRWACALTQPTPLPDADRMNSGSCADPQDCQGQTAHSLCLHIGQRNRQTVRNNAGGQGVRVGFQREIAHPEAPPGLFTGYLQGQGRFAGTGSPADDEQIAG